MKHFKIRSIDSLGQGVCSIDDKITFIEKVLPLEEGFCRVYKVSKSVQFAKLLSVEKKSPLRVKSECIHFDSCSGCHFLQTTYDQEILFKKDSLLQLLKQFRINEPTNFHLYPSSSRFGYRNRIQLHYDLKNSKLGILDNSNFEIVEIPHCLQPTPNVQEKLQELYHNNHWKSLCTGSSKGHIEIYEKNGTVKANIDQSYAHGGFSQVNSAMNNLLTELVHEAYRSYLSEVKISNGIDLFGGNGNLSSALSGCNFKVIDSTIQNTLKNSHQSFVQFNLYSKNAPEKIKDLIHLPTDLLIIDPPRSGLKNIDHFLNILKPKLIFYISCNPHTLLRDLKTIAEHYNLKTINLLDFFPGTYHYETFAILESKSLFDR